MKFTRNTVNGINDTILASNDYTAIPFTVTEAAAVKAGYPMTLAGKKATSATADGILLYDVDPAENPVALSTPKRLPQALASPMILMRLLRSRLPFLASSAVTTSA